jgi:hypothetical protein
MQRLFLPLAACAFAGGLVVYATSQMAQVSQTLVPIEASQPDRPPGDAAPAAGDREAFRDLVAGARAAEPRCVRLNPSSDIPTVHGRGVIWDLTRDDFSPAHAKLPADVRAQTPDGEVTAFLVTGQDRQYKANYRSGFFGTGRDTGVKACRVDSIVCVIGMPAQEPRGRFFLQGEEPPMSTMIRQGVSEVEGDWAGKLARWVEGCVRGPEYRAAEKEKRRRDANPPTPRGLEALALLAEQAKPALPECPARGSAGPVAPLPAKALLWAYHPASTKEYTTDRLRAPAQALLPTEHKAVPGDTEVVVFFPKEDLRQWYEGPRRENDLGRWDYTVDVVAVPGPRAVGRFHFAGETYRRRKDGKQQPPPDTNAELLAWVTKFLANPEGVLAEPAPPVIDGRGQRSVERFPSHEKEPGTPPTARGGRRVIVSDPKSPVKKPEPVKGPVIIYSAN